MNQRVVVSSTFKEMGHVILVITFFLSFFKDIIDKRDTTIATVLLDYLALAIGP